MLLSNKKKYVIISLLVLCCIFSGFEGWGQTTLYSENFDAITAYYPLTATSTPWKAKIVTGANGSTDNNWCIYSACSPPSASQCLEMYNYTTDCYYSRLTAYNKIAYPASSINATGYSSLKINFKWKAGGVGDLTGDYLMVVYSTDGTNWSDVVATKYNNSPSSWQTVTNLAIPAACENTTFYIGFRWVNDADGAGDNAGPCVDDISITGLSSSPNLSVSSLTAFGNICTSTTVGPNSFTITGSNLTTADVTVAALSGYTYSTTSGGTYTSSLTLTQPGGSFSQTIYVKFSPTAVQSYNGNIVVGGGGASSVNCAATGSGINTAPTISTPTSSSVTATTAVLGGNTTSIGCTNVTTRGIYYSTTNGFANGSGTQVSETGTYGTGTFNVNVSGLTPSTVYYYKAFSTNSGGTVYTSQGTFTTPCAPYSIPYFEGFETGYTHAVNLGSSGSNVCLSQQSVAGTYSWQSTNGGGYPSPYAGTWNANLYHSNTDWVFIQVSLVGGSIYSASVFAKTNSSSATIEIKYGTSASSSGMTSILSSTSVTGSYAEYSAAFSPASTGTYYIGIKGAPVSSNYLSIDNISIVEIDCPYPSTLTSSAITTTTATIGWTAPAVAPAQGYEYYISTTNTALNAGTTPSGSVAAGVTSANLSSLSPSTNYFFWVRSKCSASDVSDWVGAGTFSTSCGAATIPFFEGFEYGFTHDANVAGCYTQQDIAGSYQIRANNGGGYPYAGSWNANLYHDNSDWLFFRVALTAGANYGFSVFAERGAASNITVKYGTTGSAAGMTSGTIINTTALTDTYAEYTGTISPSSTGTYYIGIYLQMPNGLGYTSIDNISIVQLPDTDSKAEEPASQIAATTISSVNNITAGTAKEVFSFKITDMGTSDGLPTKVTNIRIQPGSSNNADWTDYLQGIKLYDNSGAVWVTTGAPVITDTYIDIPITSGNLDIEDAATKSLSLFAYLNSTNLIDGKILDFKIDFDNHGFTANSSFSGFATTFGSADIEGNNITVEVIATEMRFIIGQPGNGVPLSANFAVGVRATDANGNLDLGYTTGTVTLSKNSGLGTLSAVSGLTKGFTAGQALWTDVQINQAQTCPADNFTIKADHSGALPDIITSCIVVADAPGNFSITTANGNGCAGGNISVVWTASSGADTYDLYWCNTSGCDPVDGANIITNVTSPYSFTIPSNNTEYRIMILSNNVASSTWSTNTLVYGTYSGATWTGATSNNWNTASNWCGGAVPDCEDDVIILSGASNYPVLTANATVRNLSVETGATIGLGSYNLSIFGDLDLADNTLTAGTGTIVCANTGCATAIGFHYLNVGNNSLNNLTLSSGDVTLVNNALTLTGNLTINDGTFDANGYDIEIAGNWTNYALFVPGSGTVTFNGSGNSTILKNGPEVVVYQTGFEDSDGATAGWTLGSVPGKTEWRRQTGAVAGQRLAPSEGSYDINLYSVLNSKPGYAYDGTINNNSYADAQKKIDLTDVSSADISFKWYCHGTGSDEFTGVFLANGVEVDDELYTSSSPATWSTATYSLDAYCNNEAQLAFRMFLIKYSTTSFPTSAGNYGFAIDDIVITGTQSAESFNNLVINKSSGSVLLDDLSNSKLNVLGDLEIAAGTLNAQGNRLRLYGDFTNDGTFTAGGCDVLLVGETDQHIGGSSDITMYDLSINTSSDIIVGDNANAGFDLNVTGTFNWKDNNNKIVVGNGTQAKLLLPGDLTIFNGCGIETANASTISIAGHYVNYGVYTPNNGKIKFHGNTDSYIIKEPSEILFYEGFESNDGGFSLGTGSDSWARTSGSAHASNHDIAIKADAQMVPYDYLYSSADDVSATKTIDLTGYTTAELQFWWRCAGQSGADYGEVYVNGNLIMGNMNGKTSYVISPRFDISQYANGPVTLRFRWKDNGSGGNSPGLCIDDIIITGTSINMETFYDLEVDKSDNKSAILRCPIDVNNDMIIVNGKFNCSGLDFPVGRNWYNQNSSDFVHGNNKVTFDGNGESKTQIISSNSINKFYDVDIDNTGGSISLSTNRMYIENDLNIDAGILDADSQDIMIEGDWMNLGGSFVASNKTVYFRGALDQNLRSDGDAFYNMSLPAADVPIAGNPVKENRTILMNNLLINNDLTLSAGSLDINNAYDIEIKGDWFNDGGNFIHPNNESTLVKFSGTATQTANLKADGVTVNDANFSFDNVEIDGTDVKFYVDSDLYLLLIRNIVINDGKTFKIVKP